MYLARLCSEWSASVRRPRDLYCVKVPSHRANDRITGLILGPSGRPFPRFPALTSVSPSPVGTLWGQPWGQPWTRDLQSGRGEFEPFDDLVGEGDRKAIAVRSEPASLDPLGVNSANGGR